MSERARQTLPTCLYTADAVRRLDRLAIDGEGIPGYTLMTRAAGAALDRLVERWPAAQSLLVVCGAGNNAGDGYVLARLARSRGLDVAVAALVDPERLTGDAATAWHDCRDAGLSVAQWSPTLPDNCDVVVDGIFGTGLSRPVEGRFAEAIEAINAAAAPVLALDIPSGLSADTGQVCGTAIAADATVTFVGLKLGLFTGAGPDRAGVVFFDALGIPAPVAEPVPCAAHRIASDRVARCLPRRARSAHKGDNGHVLLIGGGRGYGGAIRLAGEAALRAGAGLVSIATMPEHLAIVLAGRPELMCRAVTDAGELAALLASADVVGIGPGLGRDAWARTLLDAALDAGCPLVLDADALNLLAGAPRKRDDWVLTPHPGEAARLLATDTTTVQADRPAALARLVENYGGTVVLKGAGTLVGCADQAPAVCDRGNPGMAAPGMGDVLTGIVCAIVAQTRPAGVSLFDATSVAVHVHAAAGDDAAAVRGERGLVAGDLFDPLQRRVNPA